MFQHFEQLERTFRLTINLITFIDVWHNSVGAMNIYSPEENHVCGFLGQRPRPKHRGYVT